MAPHSSTLAWKIPWMEEPGGLQSMGLQRDMTEQVAQLRVWIWGKNSFVVQLVKNLPAVQETWV